MDLTDILNSDCKTVGEAFRNAHIELSEKGRLYELDRAIDQAFKSGVR